MKHYEELAGGNGRRIHYRAERFKARDLFKRILPDLAIDNVNYGLQDISLNGLAALAGRGINDYCDVGAQVPVQLGVNGTILHEGIGEVSRIEPTPFGTKVGVRLTDRCINIPQLIAKYQETLIRADLDSGTDAAVVKVPQEYRQICADVLYLLRTYRASLGRFAETRPDAAANAAMFNACEQRMIPRWRELWCRANELVMPLLDDAAVLSATKQFTEFTLTPEFMGGAIWQRSYEKPLGYPGDFQIMNMVYNWQREGSSLFEQLLHRIGLDVAECIATRMVMMRQTIADLVLASGTEPARITSLGCGPAREIVDYLQLRSLPRPLQVTLIDQDHAALSQAYEQTYPEVMRLRGQAMVGCLHASFSQLLKAGELFGKLPAQDLIYTVGLVDYLVPKRAKALAASLFEHLAPGGRLIIGNMRKTATGNLWPMEFLCDWNIIYRDEREMLELVDDLDAADRSLEFDPTGRVIMLSVRKP
jgi:extracellular factor (EF) 3-hydroxypalmitic acid methyl ester biosynthesis protein